MLRPGDAGDRERQGRLTLEIEALVLERAVFTRHLVLRNTHYQTQWRVGGGLASGRCPVLKRHCVTSSSRATGSTC